MSVTISPPIPTAAPAPPEPPVHKRRWPWVAGLAAVVLVAGGVGLRRAWQAPPATVVVERRALVEAVDASGTVAAVDGITLRAEAAGRLRTRAVPEDQPVPAGAVLGQLDDQLARLQLEQAHTSASTAVAQAQTALDAARASLAEAQEQQRVSELVLADQIQKADVLAAQAARDLARNQELAEEGGVTVAMMDSLRQQRAQAELDARIARGNLAKVRAGAEALAARNQQAQAQTALVTARAQGARAVALAEDALARTTLHAPVAGRVTRWLVAPGDWVAAGAPVAQVLDLHGLRLKLPVDELDLPKLREGQAATIAFDAFPETPFTGRITRIGRASEAGDAGVQAFPVELTFDDPEGRVRPGMNAEAHVRVREVANALAIPLGAARREDQRLVVTRLRADGKQETVPITPGIASLEYLEVRQGLAQGDRLVTAAHK